MTGLWALRHHRDRSPERDEPPVVWPPDADFRDALVVENERLRRYARQVEEALVHAREGRSAAEAERDHARAELARFLADPKTVEAAHWRRQYLLEVDTSRLLDERLARNENRPRIHLLPDDGAMVRAKLRREGDDQ